MTSCPACGSVEVTTATTQEVHSIPFGPNLTVQIATNTCQTCGEHGDFSGSNDQLVKAELTTAQKASVARMLDTVGAGGISMAYMERALRLPARTVARWKNGETSAAALALLRIVRTFPWVLHVADQAFDPAVAQQVLVEQAANVLSGVITKSQSAGSVWCAQTEGQVTFGGHFELSQPTTPAKPTLKILHQDEA